ncbi:hypothetical protein [Schaalia sp. Marseille-Q2122]|uniref:hypothetical protein n=1 Tax=Schaalia sp. Marseille-Q2122 TaxID=2736604 RepID=UPI001C37B7CA|nr:hypothetical protein [Schaalia sp. Marseille-Q2122]
MAGPSSVDYVEIGGIVLLAAALVVLTIVPYVVARRTAITQSREIDRFSPRMRMLSDTGSASERTGEAATQRLISTSTQVRQIEGGHMVSQQGSARRPTVTSRAEKQRLREIAQLRARRAARRSTEVAAGKRRMVLSGFFATLTAVVGVAAAASTAVSWVWVLVPFGALVVSLVVSRRAAIRFEEVSRAEQARLEELMGLVPMGEADTVDRRVESDDVVGAGEASADLAGEGVAETQNEADVFASSEDEPVAKAEADRVAGEAEVPAASSGVVEGAEAVDGVEPADGIEPAEASGTTRAQAAWVPTPIPAPMYAQRARVGGRLVHPDTDLRGIPKVAASVPMRPSGMSETAAPLRSTEEVAAAQPVSFDLDAILESRRAL